VCSTLGPIQGCKLPLSCSSVIDAKDPFVALNLIGLAHPTGHILLYRNDLDRHH